MLDKGGAREGTDIELGKNICVVRVKSGQVGGAWWRETEGYQVTDGELKLAREEMAKASDGVNRMGGEREI